MDDQAQFDELEKKIAELEDKRQTQTAEFIALLREKRDVSERLKKFTEVNNCEMRIRFIEARMRGEEMPHTEYVNLERKERRKVRNRVNTMLIFVIAVFVIMIGSIPMLKLVIDQRMQAEEETGPASIPGTQLTPTNGEEKNDLTEEINATTGGETFEVSKYLQEGRRTIFDFWSAHCPACVGLMPTIKRLSLLYPDAKFYTVNIDRPFSDGIDVDSPVSQQFGLEALPYYEIYDGTKLNSKGHEAGLELRKMLQAKHAL